MKSCYRQSHSKMYTLSKTLRSNSNRLAFFISESLIWIWQEKGSETTRWLGCRKSAPLQKVARSNTPRQESNCQPLVSKQPPIPLNQEAKTKMFKCANGLYLNTAFSDFGKKKWKSVVSPAINGFTSEVPTQALAVRLRRSALMQNRRSGQW